MAGCFYGNPGVSNYARNEILICHYARKYIFPEGGKKIPRF
jgi:hypothetical protein